MTIATDGVWAVGWRDWTVRLANELMSVSARAQWGARYEILSLVATRSGKCIDVELYCVGDCQFRPPRTVIEIAHCSYWSGRLRPGKWIRAQWFICIYLYSSLCYWPLSVLIAFTVLDRHRINCLRINNCIEFRVSLILCVTYIA